MLSYIGQNGLIRISMMQDLFDKRTRLVAGVEPTPDQNNSKGRPQLRSRL